MSYADRVEREVDYLPLSRLIPAYEMTGVRGAFGEKRGAVESIPLGDEYLRWLSYIMAREYRRADFQRSRRWIFQQCIANAHYTAFNMGGGESCMIALLYLLQRIPQGGMLVVEEIEVGLHSQAQARLAEVLIEMCIKKHIQIICTSHSEPFIDALPRRARVLVRRSGGGHVVDDGPSTRLAVSETSGRVLPEVVIYCEDIAAATLIDEALPQSLRARVRIQEVGSDATVIRHGICHLRGQHRMRFLCILDGDCTERKVNNWIKSERAHQDTLSPEYLILPGDGLPPEKWLLEQLRHPTYVAEFARRFGCTIGDASRHVEALAVELDHHDLGYVLHQRTGRDSEHCRRQAMTAVAPRHPQLQPLRTRIAEMLG